MQYFVLVLFLVSARAQNATDRLLCNCPGPPAAPVCGADGQTYGNQCILDCSNMPLVSQGECNAACYPERASNCNGDFSKLKPICTIGLTYSSVAEAMCDGIGQTKACVTDGVCRYRADGQPDFLPTTGGKGIDIKDVVVNFTMPAHTDPPYDYSEALAKTLVFYDSMISGNLTAACRRRLTWRSDSCASCVGKYGEDLSGGFYEAGGSSLKYPSIVSGFSAVMLAWGGIEYGGAYARSGSMDDLRWKVKWAADHVIAAHPQEFVFAGFLGNDTWDFDYYGPLEYYDQFNPPRSVGYVTVDQPGTEVVADAAATLAAALVLLNDTADTVWKASALTHARQLYNFGKTYQGSYADSKDPAIQIMQNMYSSDGVFTDDLAWAAIWMYRATGEQAYLDDAQTFLAQSPIVDSPSFETGYKTPGAAILVASAAKDKASLEKAKTFFDWYLSLNIDHTAAGACQSYHWGGNRHVGNLAFLTLVHAKNDAVDPQYAARLVNYGMHQANYLLGDAGRSWIVGFGRDYPQYINHKMSYYSILTWQAQGEPLAEKMWMTDVDGNWSPEDKVTHMIQKAKFDYEGSRLPQAHTAWGLLFGGPLMDDGLVNSRRDYTYAEPTTEYNAGAVGAMAALVDWYNTGPYTGVEQLDGVIPFSCEAPAPMSPPAPAPAPAPLPALAPLQAPPGGGTSTDAAPPLPNAGAGTNSAAPPPEKSDAPSVRLGALLGAAGAVALALLA